MQQSSTCTYVHTPSVKFLAACARCEHCPALGPVVPSSDAVPAATPQSHSVRGHGMLTSTKQKLYAGAGAVSSRRTHTTSTLKHGFCQSSACSWVWHMFLPVFMPTMLPCVPKPLHMNLMIQHNVVCTSIQETQEKSVWPVGLCLIIL